MSPCETRIVAALKAAPSNTKTLAEVAHVSEGYVTICLKRLRASIHVMAWERNTRGPAIPIYGWGPGEDAESPSPLTPAERCKAYRKNLRLKHGENYRLVHAAQKQRVPGREIVVAGKVIYKQ